MSAPVKVQLLQLSRTLESARVLSDAMVRMNPGQVLMVKLCEHIERAQDQVDSVLEDV